MIICPQCQTINEVQSTRCATCGSPLLAGEPVLDDDPFVGRVLGGRFQLLARLGSGDIGMVYRGVDRQTGREVAVKIIHPDVAATIGEELLHSARQLAKLRHPKIASVQAAARETDGTIYIASDYVQGQTLKALLENNGPLGPRRAADILFQLCSALAPIQRLGRPHANLKPENVFLGEREGGQDFVQVVDVGVPELFGVRQTPEGQVVIGTPKYFSPEQASGRTVGLPSDQFTLGIIGYQLLTGALPFFGATPDQLLTAIMTATPTPVSKRTAGVVLPPKLEQVIDRCLAKDGAQRYPDLRALATDLAEVIKSTQPDASPAPRKAAAPKHGFMNVPTMVAGPDALSELLAADDDDDADQTVMREVPPQVAEPPTPALRPPLPVFPPKVSAPPSPAKGTPTAPPRVEPPPAARAPGTAPPKAEPPARATLPPKGVSLPSLPKVAAAPKIAPPTQNDMAKIPEPLMVTGAIDSDDLAKALADAAASVEPDGGLPSRGPRGGDDLDAALLAALADVGAEPEEQGDRGKRNGDPFAGMKLDGVETSVEGRAAEAEARAPRPAVSQRLTTEILEAIDEELIDDSMTGGHRASPLATAADLAKLAPPTVRDSQPNLAARRVTTARRSQGPTLAILAVVLVAAGVGVWWFVLRTPAPTPRPAAANLPSAAPPTAAAAPSAPPSAAPKAAEPGSVAGQAAPGSVAAPASKADEMPAVVQDQIEKQREAEAKKQAAADDTPHVARLAMVKLESEPSGATVTCGKDEVGTTPVQVEADLDTPCEYTFTLAGHDPVKKSLDLKDPPADGKPYVLKVALGGGATAGGAHEHKPKTRDHANPSHEGGGNPASTAAKPKTKPSAGSLKNPFD